jgi:predicted RND superfamily exporter protein
MMIGAHVANLLVSTAIQSYVIAFSLITPLMILFIGRLRIGLVSMVPNLSPVLIVLGVMGWAGVALDVFTVLVAGIALGLVVDDTLHILNGFRRDFAATGDVEHAIVLTMRTTGRALLFTTLVLTAAFAIYGFSGALSIQRFGLLTALAIALAFVFDLLLSPALLALVYRAESARAEASGRS